MHTARDISRTYARAFAVRARMLELQGGLRHQPGWLLASRILFRRFEMTFSLFLDGPTTDRLVKVVAFESEIAEIARRLPNPPTPCRDGLG